MRGGSKSKTGGETERKTTNSKEGGNHNRDKIINLLKMHIK